MPLSSRKHDWFFVAFFSFFVFSSVFSDAFHGLDLLDDTSFWGRANLAYAELAGDDFLIADHPFARFSTLWSAFVYGPFYALLVYAFVKGKNWIRVPAYIWAGSMIHGTIEFCWWEYSLGEPPRNHLIFWAFYGPYAVMPFLLAYRMRDAEPFGPASNAVAAPAIDAGVTAG